MSGAQKRDDRTETEWSEVEDAAALFKLATILFGPMPDADQPEDAEGEARS